MSNPFDDNAYANPFESNPFASQPAPASTASAPAPAPQSAQQQPRPQQQQQQQSAPQQQQQPAMQQSQSQARAAPAASSSSANPFVAPPPQSQAQPQSQGGVGGADMTAREAELQRRLAELERREAALRAVPMNELPPNWPKCRPLIRHDIDVDIPEGEPRSTVRLVYIVWIYHCAVLTLNMIGALAYLIDPGTAGPDPSSGTNFGVSVAFWGLGVPLSWMFWYRPLYTATRTDAASSFFLFLCNFAINTIFVILIAVGIPSGGASGFINFITAFGRGQHGAGVVMAIATAALIVNIVMNLICLKKGYTLFRGRGGMDKMKKEATGVVAGAATQAVISGAVANAQARV